MATMAFDTYKAVKDLEEVGVDEGVARVMVELFGNPIAETVATKTDIAYMATKADIADMATKSDLTNLRYKLKADIKDLESRMTVRLVGIALAIVALTSAITGVLNHIQG